MQKIELTKLTPMKMKVSICVFHSQCHWKGLTCATEVQKIVCESPIWGMENQSKGQSTKTCLFVVVVARSSEINLLPKLEGHIEEQKNFRKDPEV